MGIRGVAQNLSGIRSGRLTVLRLDEKCKTLGRSRVRYMCICDCGKQVSVRADRLKNQGTRSCGCLNAERARKGLHRTHGMTGMSFYRKFNSMWDRCVLESNNRYANYGGRGIKCLWEKFDDFKSDMYDSYLLHVKEFGQRNTTLDRIDVNGHYSKENCRWATYKEQANNRNTSHRLQFQGNDLTTQEWSEITKIHRGTIQSRINMGWSIEDALTKPPRKRRP